MKTLKVITDFSKFSEPELETLGNTIVISMTDNVLFPDLVADTALVASCLATYTSAHASAAKGGSQARAIKKDSKKALAGSMHDLAVKVNLVAKGNRIMLESSGIPLTKDPVSKNLPLGQVTGLELDKGPGHGAIKVKVDSLNRAVAYLFQYTEGPVTAGSVWISIHSTRTRLTVYGLTLGKQYFFRVAGIGSSLADPIFSEPASAYVM